MKVWMASEGRSGERNRYHTDKDCPHLNKSNRPIREKDLDVLNGHKKACKWCEGVIRQGCVKDPMERVNLLLSLDAEEV
jgi:hypothetical protein